MEDQELDMENIQHSPIETATDEVSSSEDGISLSSSFFFISEREPTKNPPPKPSKTTSDSQSPDLVYLRNLMSESDQATREEDHTRDSGICSEASNASSSSGEFNHGKISESSAELDGVKNLLEHWGRLHGVEFFSPLLPEPSYLEGDTPLKKWKIGARKKLRRKILHGISLIYSCVLIVWDTYDVRCDYFYSFLEKFGKTVSVHDRWIPHKCPQKGSKWGGAVVVYTSKKIVKLAAKEIPKKHRILHTLKMSKLIQCLVKSELKCFRPDPTTILIFAQTSGSYLDLQLLLHKLGHVVSFHYCAPTEQDLTLIEVTYTYATHAFLALIILDGLPFGSSRLRVEIKETEKECMMLHYLPQQLKKIIGRLEFPFKGI